MQWLRRLFADLSPQKPGFSLRPADVVFVVYIKAMEQISLPFFCIPIFSSVTTVLHPSVSIADSI